MAKDLLDMLVGSIKVIDLLGGVVKTVDAIEFVGKTTGKIIREANSRKFQEKEYDVEWIDIKKRNGLMSTVKITKNYMM